MKKALVGIAAVLIIAIAAIVVGFFMRGPGALPDEVEVPINGRGASNVGALEFWLVYEPAVLEVTKVEPGRLASNALFESSTKIPGSVWAALVDANGISGDGPLVVISFRVLGDGDTTSSLTLENIQAYHADTLVDIITEASAGSLVMNDRSFTAPVLGFQR